MKIVHISGHVWTHIDNIAKIEGFWQTLMIRVTLRDGAVYERFVDQKEIDKLATEKGYLARKKSYDELWRSFRICTRRIANFTCRSKSATPSKKRSVNWRNNGSTQSIMSHET